MKKVISVLIAALLITSIVGCTPKDPQSTTSEKEVKSSESVEADPTFGFEFNKKDFQGKELTIWTWWDVPLKDYQLLFEQETGAKLKFVNIPMENYQERAITAISAATGPDIILPEAFGLTWIAKGVVQPWNDYLDVTKAPFAEKIAKTLVDNFTKDGKVYGVTGGEDPYFIYYNKQLFEDEGQDDPLELWKAGNWTWETFTEINKNMTLDRNTDGVIDVYGFDGYCVRSWVLSNGGLDITMINGKPTYTMDDPRVVKALEFYRTLGIPAWTEDDDPMKRFERQAVAMMGWGSWDMKKYRDLMGENLGVVPFPMGPDCDKTLKFAPGSVGIQPNCLATGAKNPELAAHYLEWDFWERVEPEEEALALAMYGSEEIKDMFKLMKQSANADLTAAFGNTPKLLNELIYWNATDSVASITQGAKQAIQAEIDAALAQ